MKKETLEVVAAMGDRDNRETAHLLDIVIAGTIDHLRGHGTVRLLPSRLEEITDRIAPRLRDADGAWLVTLLPPADDLVPVNPYDVLAYVHEAYVGTSALSEEEQGDIASLVQAAAVPGVTLRDLGMQGFAMFTEFVIDRYSTPVDNQPG